MENTTVQTSGEKFNRFAIPLRWGIMTALFYMVSSTLVNMFMINSFAFTFMFPLIYLIIFALYCIGGVQQRKAVGGFISFKDAFQAIFIMILISGTLIQLWSYIYVKFIDPDFFDKLMSSVENIMRSMNAPEAAIEERMEEFKAQENATIGESILGFCKYLIGMSIFGFICAAIVKKKKPEFGA